MSDDLFSATFALTPLYPNPVPNLLKHLLAPGEHPGLSLGINTVNLVSLLSKRIHINGLEQKSSLNSFILLLKI